jgi:hypothetical protein
MKIVQENKGRILAENASLASNFLKRLKGLIGREKLTPGEALVIKPCNSIHTFFMRFAIDAVFLDKNNRVVKVISSMKPFRMSGIYFKAHLVIELPAGTIQETSTSAGDTLQILPT